MIRRVRVRRLGVVLLEWSEFALRLGRELAGLDRDTILIVRERAESRHYVQAMREPDRLYADAVSNNFLDGSLLLTPGDEEVLIEAGWRAPVDANLRNWWTELPSFASADDYAKLADMMVTALRDVQGVRRPADLVYESFHRHSSALIELVEFGIDVADPARVGERRAAPVLPAALPEPPHPAHEPNGHYHLNPAPGLVAAPLPAPVEPVEPVRRPPAGPPLAGPPLAGPPAPIERPSGASAQLAMRPPHGTRLCRDQGDSAATIAVYDAVSGSWTPALSEAPRGE